AAQASAESGFNQYAVSSAGARGWLQFLPSTYNAYAAQAGVPGGTWFNPEDEAKVYVAYMKALLQQEHGDLRKTLAAYNAGPANLSAGYGYADQILRQSGQGNINVPSSSVNQGVTGSSTTSSFGLPSVSDLVTSAINALLKSMGLGSMKDLLERGGLIILGFAVVLLGIHLLGKGSEAKETAVNIYDKTKTAKETSDKTQALSGKAAKARAGTGAASAVEAAAVA